MSGDVTHISRTDSTNMENHTDLLRKNHVSLVEALDPDIFIDQLDPFLRTNIHEKMQRKNKARQLLHNLSRGSQEKFDKFCKVIAGVHPNLFEILQGRPPSSEESNSFFLPFYKELCEGIRTTGSRPDSKIDQKIDLDTQFVSLKLTDRCFDEAPTYSHVDETGNDSPDTDEEFDEAQSRFLGSGKVVKENIVMEDILPPDFTGKSVLLQGRAGVGKSTLAQFWAKEWAKGKLGSAFKGVFILNLRRLVHNHEKISLSELLGMYAEYIVESPDPEKPSIEWLKHNADKVLIFTDGIDELPELGKLVDRIPTFTRLDIQATPLTWCVNLIKKNVLPECTTVVVSRPFIGLRCLKYDREIEVFGLQQEQIMQFVERNVRCDRVEAVKDALIANPMLLSVCSITFYCAAICKVLEMDTTLDASSFTTYTRITAYIITQFASRQAAEECTTSVLPEEFTECLSELSALAYLGLLGSGHDTSRLVFDQTDFNKVRLSPSKMRMAKQTGLLHYKEVSTPLRQQLQAEFVHLSIQEMLAMCSLAKASKEEIRQFFGSSVGRFNMSKLFAFGLFLDKSSSDIAGICDLATGYEVTKQKGEHISDTLVEVFNEMCANIHDSQDETEWLQLMHMAYESQQPHLARAIGEAVTPDKEFTLSQRNLTTTDLKAILFCLSQAGCKKLTLSHIFIDAVTGSAVETYLMDSHENRTLELQANNMTDQGLLHISEGVRGCETLQVLRVIDNEITDTGIMYLANGIRSSKLQVLHFLYEKVNTGRLKVLEESIESNRYIKQLHFHVYSNSTQCLPVGISCNTELKTILFKIEFNERSDPCNLGGQVSHVAKKNPSIFIRNDERAQQKFVMSVTKMHLTCDKMHQIAKIYSVTMPISALLFTDCYFQENSMEVLSKSVASSGIQELSLWNVLNPSCYKYLPSGFGTSATLTRVGLRTFTPADDHDLHYVAEFLSKLPNLQVLWLTKFRVSPAPYRSLIQAIGSHPTLNELHVIEGCLTLENTEDLSHALGISKTISHLTLKNITVSPAGQECLLRAAASLETFCINGI